MNIASRLAVSILSLSVFAPCSYAQITPNRGNSLPVRRTSEDFYRAEAETNRAMVSIRMGGRFQRPDNIALWRSYLKPNDRPNSVRQADEPLRPTTFLVPALQALGRVGATDVLPEIDEVISDSYWKGGTADYARIIRARILASQQKDRREKLTVFLQEIDLSVARLNQADILLKESFKIADGSPPLEVRALRELADMIYLERDLPLLDAAKTAGIDFNKDEPAAMKIRFAPLSSKQRVETLINEMAEMKVDRVGHGNFLIQLAINEGEPAGVAAAAKLRQMLNGPRFVDKAKTYEESRAAFEKVLNSKGVYTRVGFTILLQVVAGMGDPSYLPLVEQLTRDKDFVVSQHANMLLPAVKHGSPRQTALF